MFVKLDRYTINTKYIIWAEELPEQVIIYLVDGKNIMVQRGDAQILWGAVDRINEKPSQTNSNSN